MPKLTLEDLTDFNTKTQEEIEKYVDYTYYNMFRKDLLNENFFFIGMILKSIFIEMKKNPKIANSLFEYVTKKFTRYFDKSELIMLLTFLSFCHKNKLVEEKKIIEILKNILYYELSKHTIRLLKSNEAYLCVSYLFKILKHKNKEEFYKNLFTFSCDAELLVELMQDYNSLKSNYKQKVEKLVAKNYYKLNEINLEKLNLNCLDLFINIILKPIANNEQKAFLLGKALSLYKDSFFEKLETNKNLKRLDKLVSTTRDLIVLFLGKFFERNKIHELIWSKEDILLLNIPIANLPENWFYKAVKLFHYSPPPSTSWLCLILLNNPLITKEKNIFIKLIKKYLKEDPDFKTISPVVEIDQEIINSLEDEELLELLSRSVDKTYLTPVKFELNPVRFKFNKETLELIKKRTFAYMLNESKKEKIIEFFKAHLKNAFS